jgi:predicted DNA-binding antitoxin AbrB/MazE fold protein
LGRGEFWLLNFAPPGQARAAAGNSAPSELASSFSPTGIERAIDVADRRLRDNGVHSRDRAVDEQKFTGAAAGEADFVGAEAKIGGHAEKLQKLVKAIPRCTIDSRPHGHFQRRRASQAMELSIEATYENGVLKPAEPLPLAEHEKVRVTISQEAEWRVSRVRATYGLMGGKLDAEVIERIALDPEFGIEESP